MKKVRNMLNYTRRPGKKFKTPSKTIPGDGLTVKQILTAHTSGMSPAIQKTPEYHPEDSPFAGLDVAKLDLIDLQNMSKHIVNLRTNAENELKKRQKAEAERQDYERRLKIEQEAIADFKAKQGDGKKQ